MDLYTRSQWALTIVRVLLGGIFVLHGSQKMLGLFGGPGMAGFANWLFTTYAIPLYIGYAAAVAEFVGGGLLLLGICTQVGAVLVIGIMAGAIYLVHLPHGFFVQNGGYEYSLTLLILAVALIIGGPGYFALWDKKFFNYLF